jgi:hypothetical protein
MNITITKNEKISFEKYIVTEGFPEEYVMPMIQDKQGFIFFFFNLDNN